MPDTVPIGDEEVLARPFKPLYLPRGKRAALFDQTNPSTPHPFLLRPFWGSLIFINESSDIRDHCANERTFLAWLRLSTYLAICSVAIVITFHIKSKPSDAEKKVALPLGLVFWVLSLACLISGLATYVQTVERYGRRAALVQSGPKTQLVFTVVAVAIIATCIFFLSVNANGRRS